MISRPGRIEEILISNLSAVGHSEFTRECLTLLECENWPVKDPPLTPPQEGNLNKEFRSEKIPSWEGPGVGWHSWESAR